MLPSVVDEKLVHRFQYWNGTLHYGMCYRQELFTLLQTYTAADRLKAYAMGCALSEKGTTICITAGTGDYSVWASLRSMQIPVPDQTPRPGKILDIPG